MSVSGSARNPAVVANELPSNAGRRRVTYRMSHTIRRFYQTFHTTQALRERRDPEGRHKLFRLLLRGILDPEADDASEGHTERADVLQRTFLVGLDLFSLLFGIRKVPSEVLQFLLGITAQQLLHQVKRRIGPQTGVSDLLNALLLFQPMRNAQRVQAVPQHTHAQSFEGTAHEVTIPRTGNAAEGILDKPQTRQDLWPGREEVRREDERAENNVRVTRAVFAQ